MNPLKTASKQIQDAFAVALKSKDFGEALGILTANDCTVTPSQAPELKAAIRANPSLIDGTAMVAKATGGRTVVTDRVLANDVDEVGAVVEAWLHDVVSVEDEFPHYASHRKAKYRIEHHCFMGSPGDVVNEVRAHGVSVRRDDLDGDLARQILHHFGSLSGADRRALLVEDARSIAVRRGAA